MKQKGQISWVKWLVTFVVLVSLLTLLLLAIRSWYLSTQLSDWWGVQSKTFWDWLELLLVPAALAFGAFLLNRWQTNEGYEKRRVEQDIARESRLQQTLDEYYDRMSDLILNYDPASAPPGSAVRDLARARSLAALSALDGVRKGYALEFLSDAGLLMAPTAVSTEEETPADPPVDLKRADLEGVIIEAGHFRNCGLRQVDFSGSQFGDVWIGNCDLSLSNFSRSEFKHLFLLDSKIDDASFYRAKLNGSEWNYVSARYTDFRLAYLRETHLEMVDFTQVDLAGADLTGARFYGRKSLEKSNLDGTIFANVDMSGADLREATGLRKNQILQAERWAGAIMPDGVHIRGYNTPEHAVTIEEWIAVRDSQSDWDTYDSGFSKFARKHIHRGF